MRTRPKESTALAFPRRYSRMGINGDGSTLNLDFTAMSTLDSRFTFSRTSNATYINSSGYVAWNNSNLFYNTAWTSTSLPTGWAEGAVTGTFTYNGNGTITMTVATAQRAYLHPAFPYTPTQIGVPFTISCTVTAVSGSPTLADVITTNAGTDTFTVNGVAKTSAEILFANDLITCTSTATANATVPRIGMGVLSAVTNKSITLKNPQANIGSTAQTYTPNTSTTTSYYAPRFDYDPTTLAAKGLLIEGQGINLTNYSGTFDTAFWNFDGFTRTIVTGTAPSGTGQSILQTQNAAGGNIRSNAITVTASTAYTFSFWAKNNGGTKASYRVWNASAGSAIVDHTSPSSSYFAQLSSTVWNRISVTFTTPAGCTSIFIYTISENSSGGNLFVWGAQLELGTSASSYIPTVASQVTRAQELCTLPITPASIGLTTSPIGTCFYEATVNHLPTSGFPLIVGFTDIGNNSKAWLSQTSTTGSNYSAWKTTTGTVEDVTFANVVIPKTSFKFASSISSTQNLASRNGTAGTAGAVSSAVLSVPTQLNFGGVIESMIITKFKFFPSAKSQAELNALST